MTVLVVASLTSTSCKSRAGKPAEQERSTQIVDNPEYDQSLDTGRPLIKPYAKMFKNGKIDKELLQRIEHLADTAAVTCLVYPARNAEDVKNLLENKKGKDVLGYNYLQLAGCFAVNLQKKTLLELVAEETVGRISDNPTFKANE